MKKLFKRKKVALVLGGGSARGLCNIGVIETLKKNCPNDGIPFDLVVGSSIGSLIGATYCLGIPLSVMKEKALKIGWRDLVDPGVRQTGLLKGEKLEKIIRDVIGDKGFRDMKKPFALTTTNIETGEEIYHTSGDLIKLIRASCSWPGIFSAVNVDGKLLADGGIRNSVPTKVAHKLGADFVVAVNPGFCVKNQKIDNVLKAFVQSVQILGEELNDYQSRLADIAIVPHLENVDQFDFDQANYIISQGRIATEKKMHKIKLKLKYRCRFL